MEENKMAITKSLNPERIVAKCRDCGELIINPKDLSGWMWKKGYTFNPNVHPDNLFCPKCYKKAKEGTYRNHKFYPIKKEDYSFSYAETLNHLF